MRPSGVEESPTGGSVAVRCWLAAHRADVAGEFLCGEHPAATAAPRRRSRAPFGLGRAGPPHGNDVPLREAPAAPPQPRRLLLPRSARARAAIAAQLQLPPERLWAHHELERHGPLLPRRHLCRRRVRGVVEPQRRLVRLDGVLRGEDDDAGVGDVGRGAAGELVPHVEEERALHLEHAGGGGDAGYVERGGAEGVGEVRERGVEAEERAQERRGGGVAAQEVHRGLAVGVAPPHFPERGAPGQRESRRVRCRLRRRGRWRGGPCRLAPALAPLREAPGAPHERVRQLRGVHRRPEKGELPHGVHVAVLRGDVDGRVAVALEDSAERGM